MKPIIGGFEVRLKFIKFRTHVYNLENWLFSTGVSIKSDISSAKNNLRIIRIKETRKTKLSFTLLIMSVSRISRTPLFIWTGSLEITTTFPLNVRHYYLHALFLFTTAALLFTWAAICCTRPAFLFKCAAFLLTLEALF